MNLELEYLTDKIMPYFESKDWREISELFDSLKFKYDKSLYHYENIAKKIEETTDFEQMDYYENIYPPLYFELESFLVSARSTVDIVMHIINQTLNCGIEKSNVHLGTIFKSAKLHKNVRNALNKYTHNRGNLVWDFIYQYRNEVVHEKSINQSLTITIDFFQMPKPLAYFEVNGEHKNILTFIKTSLNFLRRFITQICESIAISIEK